MNDPDEHQLPHREAQKIPPARVDCGIVRDPSLLGAVLTGLRETFRYETST